MQNFPNKPIRFITVDIGSSLDFLTRFIAQGISGPLGQPVIVENRPIGIIPGEIVARAAPDGYTLLVIAQHFWTGPLLENTPYDPVTDFSPVTLAATSPLMVVVHPSVAANSVKDLIALAQARPGELSYAAGLNGSSSQLGGALFTRMAGVNIVRIPYKSGGPAGVSDLLAGKVHLMLPSAGTGMPLVKSGRVRALAVTSAVPSALAPGLPTVAASGLPGYEVVQTIGVFAPAKTPVTVILRLNQEIVRFLNTAEAKERLLNAALEAVGSTPEALAYQVRSEMAMWGKVIKDVGIHANY